MFILSLVLLLGRVLRIIFGQRVNQKCFLLLTIIDNFTFLKMDEICLRTFKVGSTRMCAYKKNQNFNFQHTTFKRTLLMLLFHFQHYSYIRGFLSIIKLIQKVIFLFAFISSVFKILHIRYSNAHKLPFWFQCFLCFVINTQYFLSTSRKNKQWLTIHSATGEAKSF